MKAKIDNLQTYTWEGRNKRGIRVDGEMAAASTGIVQAELRRQQIDPTKIRKKSKSLFDNEKPINTLDVVIFTRHLATMINAGLPLVQSLDIVGRGHEKVKMQRVILAIKNNVAGGKSFADSLSQYPEHFDFLFCNLIRTSEQSGTMDGMLKRIADYLEKTESLKKKIKKALTYPLAILSVTFIVAAILLIFVVPQFEKLFSSYGAQLPTFTRMIMSMSETLQQHWLMVFTLIGASIYGFITAKKRIVKFKEFVEASVLKLPVFGELIEKAIIARTMRTLSTTMAAGIPLIEALTSVSSIAGNAVYRNALIRIREDVETGQNMHVAMATTHLFPSMVTQMIAVGEESGSMESMMDKIATFYEEDVDNMVSSLSSLLEPLIMVILGVIIGGFVLAMYLPIFKLGSIF